MDMLEIRLEALKLAKKILEQQYYTEKSAASHIIQCMSLEKKDYIASDHIKYKKIFKELMPAIYTGQEIIDLASKFINFIEHA